MKVAILLAVTVATALVFLFSTGERSLARLRKAGVIRIGYAVEAPYAFLKEGGQVTGEAPEIARRIVAGLGIPRIEWVQTEFGSLISELQAGRFDVIAAGMFITRERAKQVAFSEPTFHVGEGLLVLSGNPEHLGSYRQAADRADVKLAVLGGSIEESLLRRMGMATPRLLVVPDARTGMTAVETGVVDGLALSSPTITWMERQQSLGRTAAARPFAQTESAGEKARGYGAFVFRKNDRALLAAWNAQLHGFIGSPEHRRLAERFCITADELPGSATTATILEKE